MNAKDFWGGIVSCTCLPLRERGDPPPKLRHTCRPSITRSLRAGGPKGVSGRKCKGRHSCAFGGRDPELVFSGEACTRSARFPAPEGKRRCQRGEAGRRGRES